MGVLPPPPPPPPPRRRVPGTITPNVPSGRPKNPPPIGQGSNAQMGYRGTNTTPKPQPSSEPIIWQTEPIIWQTTFGLQYMQTLKESEAALKELGAVFTEAEVDDMVRREIRGDWRVRAEAAEKREVDLQEENKLLLAQIAGYKDSIEKLDPSKNDVLDATNAGFVMVKESYWREQNLITGQFYRFILSSAFAAFFGFGVFFIGEPHAALLGLALTGALLWIPQLLGIKRFIR